ncbi:hypothetical protein BOCO_0261 [Bombiscardovia coagulans]|uniref:Uncharacterized protein n=1 Tax=Bombiscardovia coagulans TaxID=686666 RepID=A0A261EUW8_9BIFI|nr:hypothetical protein BOCO_0261 [Bombiscardovia coagulans]
MVLVDCQMGLDAYMSTVRELPFRAVLNYDHGNYDHRSRMGMMAA